MAADSSSYNLILDHVLSYPASYEMPLRTMYTLNCAPRAQPLPHHLATLQPLPEESSSGSSTDSAGCIGNSLGQSATTAKQATAHFTSSLMEHIAHLPSQPCSLPPSFINTFARRCFPADLAAVDFPHALTSLDYIKDLEMRRRRDFAAALHRLGLDRTTLQSADADRFAHSFPAVAAWLRSMDDRERKVDALYTQLYVAVRRWVLINEMSLTPFNRHNCVAMLNTLYPPVMSTPPTSKLTPAIFKSQREGFFRYIQAVERSGPKVLSTLMQQGKRPRDSDGWGAVADTIDAYLRVACGSIAEILDITSKDHFAAAAAAAVSAAEKNRRHGRKVDSGVSFGSDRSATAAGAAASTASDSRPSTGESSTFRPAGSAAAAAAFRSPQSPSPSDPCSIAPSPTQSNTASRGGSALERIARELRRMGRRPKLEIEEINTKPGSLMPTATSAARTSPSASSSSSLSSAVEQRQQQQQQQQPPAPVLANPPPRSSSAVSMINKRGLRKMKSLGALVEMRQPNGSVGSAINDVGAARKGSEASALNSYEAQRRHRLLYDALAEK